MNPDRSPGRRTAAGRTSSAASKQPNYRRQAKLDLRRRAHRNLPCLHVGQHIRFTRTMIEKLSRRPVSLPVRRLDDLTAG